MAVVGAEYYDGVPHGIISLFGEVVHFCGVTTQTHSYVNQVKNMAAAADLQVDVANQNPGLANEDDGKHPLPEAGNA